MQSDTVKSCGRAEVGTRPAGLSRGGGLDSSVSRDYVSLGCDNHLCTCMIEEGGDGESSGSVPLSLLSYTLRFCLLYEVKREIENTYNWVSCRYNERLTH
jgi:hypothetical protein